jgi:diguanylate cyclase (GGDEF)-like protein
MTRRIPWLGPRWRVVVTAAAVLGGGAFVLALALLSRDGVHRPLAIAIGTVATVAVNRIYVLVARRGGVLEGIDIAELALVALVLTMPPAEALVTFAAASLLVEVSMDRALVKKVFNVGMRAMAAGLAIAMVQLLAPYSGEAHLAQYVAAALGGITYAVVNALWLAGVVSSVEAKPFPAVFADGLPIRLAVAIASTVAGLATGRLATHAPLALVGIAALLVLLTGEVRVARQAQKERDKLTSVLEATTRIQAAGDPDEQEAALVEATRELLLWRDVEVRALPPGDGELGSPLYVRDGVERWLVARPRVDSDPWSREDAAIVDSLAVNASAALERVQLQQKLGRLALIDPLTGLANRRHMDEALSLLLAPANSRPFALLVLDLVNFKSVNDDYGHAVGDDVLRLVAERLHTCVRQGDLVARLGGDEFVAVLPGWVSRSTVRAIADTMHARIAEPMTIGAAEVQVDVSIGHALAPADGSTVAELMRAADIGMYDNKARQRSATFDGIVAVPLSRTSPTDELQELEA